MCVVIGKDKGELQVEETKLIMIHCHSEGKFVVERHQAVHLIHVSIH